MQAVLDTNIVVSALLWGGTPFKLLELATDGKLSLYTSPALIAESLEEHPHPQRRRGRAICEEREWPLNLTICWLCLNKISG